MGKQNRRARPRGIYFGDTDPEHFGARGRVMTIKDEMAAIDTLNMNLGHARGIVHVAAVAACQGDMLDEKLLYRALESALDHLGKVKDAVDALVEFRNGRAP